MREILKLIWLCLLPYLAFGEVYIQDGLPRVDIKLGKLNGKILTHGRNGKQYYGFLGIPYGEKPELFQPPKPFTTKWKGVKVVDEYTPFCPQRDHNGKSVGDEDCLYLNIFVPDTSKDPGKKYSVMVWIHGGAFRDGGAGFYSPDYIVPEGDVILVTIKYRLGIFGFLSTEDHVVSGNMGLKDQVLALKFVKDNIEKFNGNPNDITIFGESAGGVSVHFLLLSPMAKNLFNQAIAMSGSSLMFWGSKRHPLEFAKGVGKTLGCPTESSEKMIACMKTRTTDELLTAQHSQNKWYIDPFVFASPTIENGTGPEIFLSDTPENIVAAGKYHGRSIPLIISFCAHEGLMFHAAVLGHNDALRKDLDTNWEKIAPMSLNFDDYFPKDNLTSLVQDTRKFYMGYRTEFNAESFYAYTDIFTDSNFAYPIYQAALHQARSAPTYFYVLKFVGEYSVIKGIYGIEERQGVSHADDLQYLFPVPVIGNPPFTPGSKSEKFSKDLVQLWTSFAKEGKPSAMYGSVKEWKPISKSEIENPATLTIMELNEDSKLLINNPYFNRFNFWDRIFAKYLPSYPAVTKVAATKPCKEEL